MTKQNVAIGIMKIIERGCFQKAFKDIFPHQSQMNVRYRHRRLLENHNKLKWGRGKARHHIQIAVPFGHYCFFKSSLRWFTYRPLNFSRHTLKPNPPNHHMKNEVWALLSLTILPLSLLDWGPALFSAVHNFLMQVFMRFLHKYSETGTNNLWNPPT